MCFHLHLIAKMYTKAIQKFKDVKRPLIPSEFQEEGQGDIHVLTSQAHLDLIICSSQLKYRSYLDQFQEGRLGKDRCYGYPF
jgi:hypothetical protein